MRNRLALALLLVLAQAGATQAQDSQAASRLRPIVIVPSGGAADSRNAEPGSSIAVVPAASAWRGYRGLAELLEQTTGIQLRRMGGREDSSSLLVRGAGGGRVKVLVDGIPLTRAGQDTVNLADIPVNNIERIEVYKGFVPSAFVSAGAESAVNIITRNFAAGPRVSISAGSFGTRRLHAATGARLGDGRLAVGMGLSSTRGDFRYTDDNGTEAFSGDDIRRRRENNRHSSADLTAAWRSERPDGSRLTLRDNLFHKDEGLPGLGSNESPRSRLRMTRNIASLSWEGPGGMDRTELGMTLERYRLSDPKSAGEDIAGIGLPFELEVSTGLALDASRHWRRAWGQAQLLELGLAAAFERSSSRYPGSGSQGGAQERLRLSGVVADEVSLPVHGLDLVAQLRHETLWNRFDGNALVPGTSAGELPSARDSSTDLRVGLDWRPDEEVLLHAGAATYFRPPSFSELFGNDGFSVANPGLGPEKGHTKDMGMTARLPLWPQRLGGAQMAWTYFDNDAEDMILYVQTGARVAKALNIGRARTRGHEIELGLGRGRAVGLELGYTAQRATNLSPYPDYQGKDLPGLPEQELDASLRVERPRWSAVWTVTHRSGFFLDQANNPLRRVPTHTIHGLRLGLSRAADELRLDIELDNLTGEQYADEYGFPVPGRALYITVSSAAPTGK